MTQNRLADIPMPSKLGDRIREARRRLNLTQGDVAGNDYSISYISAIERNKIRPSLKALAWMASRLSVSLSDLVVTDAAIEGDEETAAEVQDALFAARLALAYRRPDEARDALQAVRDKARAPSQRVQLSLLLAEALIGLGDGQGAREAAEQARALTSDTDAIAQEHAKNLLGQACYILGLYMMAMEYHYQCLTNIEGLALHDPALELSVLYNLGNDLLQVNEPEEAIRMFKRAEVLGKKLQASQSAARLYWQIGDELRKEGQIFQAQRFSDLAVEQLRSAESRSLLVVLQSHLALILAERGESRAAEDEMRQALDLAQREGEPQASSIALSSWSRFQLERRKVAEAVRVARQALEEAQRAGESEPLGHAHIALAEAQAASDDLGHAEEHFKKGIEYLTETNAQADLIRAYEHFADLLARSGKIREAYTCLKQAHASQHQ
jgi:tetratricopeptide (TPR) repeat protein